MMSRYTVPVETAGVDLASLVTVGGYVWHERNNKTEIVLQQRPTQLLIKLKAPTSKLQNTYGDGARMIYNIMLSKQNV